MPYRGMAIDSGAVGEQEIQRYANHFAMYDEYVARLHDEHDYDLLGEMQFRGVRIFCQAPVIEETPDTTA